MKVLDARWADEERDSLICLIEELNSENVLVVNEYKYVTTDARFKEVVDQYGENKITENTIKAVEKEQLEFEEQNKIIRNERMFQLKEDIFKEEDFINSTNEILKEKIRLAETEGQLMLLLRKL